MAGGGFTNEGQLKRAHLYEYRFTWYFFNACIVAALGGSLFGYDLGVSGNSNSLSLSLCYFFPLSKDNNFYLFVIFKNSFSPKRITSNNI